LRLLILGLNYLPESTSIGPFTADLAEYMKEHGHQVQVVTGFPMAPQWKVWAPYRGRCFVREVIHGVPVLRTYLYVPEDPSRVLRRILFDMSFAVSSFLGGLSVRRCDLVVVISPPLQLGITGWLLGLVKGGPVFFHIKDLIPDAAVAAGALSERGVTTRMAYAVERFVYRRARSIGVICEGFARSMIQKGVPAEKIVLLPDYVDLEFMRPSGRNNGFRRQHGVKPDEFLVMYSGSIALKQGLETFVETAAELRDASDVVLYLVGEGPYLQDLKARAQDLRLANLRFLPLQPRETLPLQLPAADALVITQKRAIREVVFPGKLLYYMASARPIVAAVNPESETGRFVASQAVGFVVPPEAPKALAEAIRFLRASPQEADRLGRNGRRVAEEKFDRRIVLKNFAEHLETLLGDA